MNWRHLLLSLDGRIPRRAFWLGVGAIFAFQFVIQTPLARTWDIDIDRGLAPLWFRNLSLFLDVICAWPLFAVLSKRQQDRNQDANLSFVLVALVLIFSTLEAFGLTQEGSEFTAVGLAAGVPLLGVFAIVLIELGGRRGSDGPNRFGPDPLR